MAQKVIPVAVDTKTLTAMTGLSRQRLDKLRKDPKSGFPKPSRIGRSVRYNVEEVMQWLEAVKAGNSALLQKMVQRNLVQPGTQKVPAPCPVQQPTHKAMPTVAEVNLANKKTCSTILAKGQRCVGNLIETADGPPTKYYRVLPRSMVDPTALRSTHRIVLHQVYLAGGKAIQKQTKTDVALPCFNTPQVDTKEIKSPTYIGGAEVGGPAPLEGPDVEALKQDYDRGLSLDALCILHHIGKTRASKLLRAAGARIRKPGRSRTAPTDTSQLSCSAALP